MEHIEELLRAVDHKSDLMQTVLMIREPDSTMAADAFTGLRKQVASASKHHWAHMAQLAEMDVALHQAQTLDELKTLVSQWLSIAGLVRLTTIADPNAVDAFDVISEEGPRAEVLQPAYVDQATGRVIKNGRLAFVAVTTPPPVLPTVVADEQPPIGEGAAPPELPDRAEPEPAPEPTQEGELA